MPWAAVAGVVGGALIANNGARSAAKTQAGAADRASADQRAMYDQTRADNMPALEARNSSLARVQEMLGIGGNKGALGYGSWAQPIKPMDVLNEGGYQFGLNQGNNNIQGRAAAAGGLFSGATGKALVSFGNDYATSKYGDAYNRIAGDQDRQRNALFGVAGLGSTGATTIAQSGANAANQIGANTIGAGNAQGASIIAGSNALQNGVNALGYQFSRQQQSAPQTNYGGAGADEWWNR